MDTKSTEGNQVVEQLAELAKRWLAMDGLWFQAVENAYGIEMAIELDKEVWRQFSPLEAKRIMSDLGIGPGGGLDALEQALRYRCYAYINKQEISRPSPDKCVLKMVACRVQDARSRKGLTAFPCKQVGIIEYESFAGTIDPSIKVKCIACPPDEEKREFWCGWEFTIER